MKHLVFSQIQNLLELDGQPLHCGDALEVHIMGSWVLGILASDRSGWYLITQEQNEIRLQTGLLARLSSSHVSSPTE